MKNIFLALIAIFTLQSLTATEGMWIPMLIEKEIISDMKAEGFKLEAEDIYSVNQACLKDAVMIFGGGCTGEFISDQGLLLTNHHCGYSKIQALSSVENDYLTHGYWAMSREEELYSEGLSVKILNYMEDVTDEVLQGVTDDMDMVQRNDIIRKNSNALQDSLAQDEKYNVVIKPFYKGNQYLVFVSTEYNDVRFVGAPPSAIGKFGGDTDNWMWPRHGGDFSLFRVYANADNQPAFYSKDNKPFQPQKSLTVSLKGVDEGDFTFVFGYPGSTDSYATSYKLKMLVEDTYPIQIGARTTKLDVMNATMEKSPELRLKYSAKSNSVSNSWKRWQGEIKGMDRFSVIQQKIESEKAITQWINADAARRGKYGDLLPQYKSLYEELTPLTIADNVIYELIGRNGMETVAWADFVPTVGNMSDSSAQRRLNLYHDRIQKHFKNFDLETDKELTVDLLNYYMRNVSREFIVDTLKRAKIEKKGTQVFVDQIFKKTAFADSIKLKTLFAQSPKKIDKMVTKDPARNLKMQLSAMRNDVLKPEIKIIENQLDSLNRLYMAALMEYDTALLYSDANFTLRVTYGHVAGASPKNGIEYKHYTTIDGIIEKDNPNIYDYQVPSRLKELYYAKDYGQYANESGELPVCFLASNHTTGGNSGSPLLNAEGQLVGLNFDRMWEGVMSDLYYTPEICRNISVDIRYVLFIIDKFAGAGYLLDEMDIVK